MALPAAANSTPDGFSGITRSGQLSQKRGQVAAGAVLDAQAHLTEAIAQLAEFEKIARAFQIPFNTAPLSVAAAGIAGLRDNLDGHGLSMSNVRWFA